MKITKIPALKELANKVRLDIIQEIYYAKSGHPGGSLSIADILTVLYFNEMHIDPEKPEDPARDRLVLSKGHASSALYAVLCERGYFPKENLVTFRNVNSILQGHPDMSKVPGVDMSTGSLGQGLSVANGMAMASKMDQMGNRVYCILGDGEIQEGQIWEAAMTSSKYNLDNLCVIVDNNNLQLSDSIENIKDLNTEDIENKFKSFGFHTMTIDGNDVESIMSALSTAETVKGKPTCVIAKTIKGKGVSFMENNVSWHGKSLSDEDYRKAVEELTSNTFEYEE
jgi:transketolase